MSAIDDLKSKVTRLEDQLRAAKTSLLEAEKAACPFQPGDIIEKKGWRIGDRSEFKVIRLGTRYGSLRVVAVGRRKNGGWMERETELSPASDSLTKIGREA